MGANREYSSLTRDALTPPPNRGGVWYDGEIPEQFFRGRVSVRTPAAHQRHQDRSRLAWSESDSLAWFE